MPNQLNLGGLMRQVGGVNINLGRTLKPYADRLEAHVKSAHQGELMEDCPACRELTEKIGTEKPPRERVRRVGAVEELPVVKAPVADRWKSARSASCKGNSHGKCGGSFNSPEGPRSKCMCRCHRVVEEEV